MVDNSFATLRSELGLLLDKTRHLRARQEDQNPRENEYDTGFAEGYSAAMRCMEGNIHELLTATWAYCDTQEKPVSDLRLLKQAISRRFNAHDKDSSCNKVYHLTDCTRGALYQIMDAIDEVLK